VKPAKRGYFDRVAAPRLGEALVLQPGHFVPAPVFQPTIPAVETTTVSGREVVPPPPAEPIASAEPVAPAPIRTRPAEVIAAKAEAAPASFRPVADRAPDIAPPPERVVPRPHRTRTAPPDLPDASAPRAPMAAPAPISMALRPQADEAATQAPTTAPETVAEPFHDTPAASARVPARPRPTASAAPEPARPADMIAAPPPAAGRPAMEPPPPSAPPPRREHAAQPSPPNIHIGVVEVRVAPQPPAPPPPAPVRPIVVAPPPPRSGLARQFGWRYGLGQS
jgi:hypothetical protein